MYQTSRPGIVSVRCDDGRDMGAELARVPGFEPGAYRLGGGCSIQLSYTRVSLQALVY